MTEQRRIDFKTGYPDLALVPRDLLLAITTDLLRENRGMQYAGDVAGSQPAREQIAAMLHELYGIPVQTNELILTTGALASIDIVCRALTSPDDVVIVESPTFYFAVTIIEACRVQIVSVPMGHDGINLSALELALRQYGSRVKVVYTIPAFHNPTGICATVENRRGLIALARQYGFTILEDATYQPLYFESPPPPLIQSLDDSGRVATVASVSKLIMPALRLGWIYAPADKIALYKRGKADGASSLLSSEIVASFAERGEFLPQVERARALYKRKHHAMVSALDRYAPAWLEWDAPNGGYFVWAKVPPHVSVKALLGRANTLGVDFFAGSASFVDGNDDSHLRLCFALMSEDEIEQGIARLSEALHEFM